MAILYGQAPADPIGRLFSTVTYARAIIFAQQDDALLAIDKITNIHSAVEKSRGAGIPDWAYRDVLYMLIHYSVASFELLERPLTETEKAEVFDVFYRLGKRMQLQALPVTYAAWQADYATHLENDLAKTNYTTDLFKQYKKHLGGFRYYILIEAQKLLVPKRVHALLGFGKFSAMRMAIPAYKCLRWLHLDGLLKTALLPRKYLAQVRSLDVHEQSSKQFISS